jgi:hypothetical protein
MTPTTTGTAPSRGDAGRFGAAVSPDRICHPLRDGDETGPMNAARLILRA